MVQGSRAIRRVKEIVMRSKLFYRSVLQIISPAPVPQQCNICTTYYCTVSTTPVRLWVPLLTRKASKQICIGPIQCTQTAMLHFICAENYARLRWRQHEQLPKGDVSVSAHYFRSRVSPLRTRYCVCGQRGRIGSGILKVGHLGIWTYINIWGTVLGIYLHFLWKIRFLYARLQTGRIMVWWCPSVRVSVRPSVRPSQFSALFSYMLWHIDLKFCVSLYFYARKIKFECH